MRPSAWAIYKFQSKSIWRSILVTVHICNLSVRGNIDFFSLVKHILLKFWINAGFENIANVEAICSLHHLSVPNQLMVMSKACHRKEMQFRWESHFSLWATNSIYFPLLSRIFFETWNVTFRRINWHTSPLLLFACNKFMQAFYAFFTCCGKF